MSKNKIYDAIVVGLGGVGSFALRSLSRRKVTSTEIGKACNSSGIFDGVARGRSECGSNEHANVNENANVLGLKEIQIGHDMGSSHGSSRLFRSAYFDVPLCLRSTKVFQELSDWKLSMVKANEEEKKEQQQQQNLGVDLSSENSDFTPLLERCGVLVVSDGGKNGKYEIIEKCANAAEIFKIPIVRMEDSTQIRER